MDHAEYFATTPAPCNLQDVAQRTRDFVAYNSSLNRRVVLVSSGGTTVPLENQTVRFLDNFSAGTRGATSAEYFIQAGYAVLFLHRQFSLEPYTRHYTHAKNCFLDFLTADPDGHLRVVDQHQSEIASALVKYQDANKNCKLLKIGFVTVHDYLFYLRQITMEMSTLGCYGMYYLAAAVSDYYIPHSKMIEHKIQSADGALSLQLEQVPKVIKPLVHEWAEHGFIVSFKLETDESFLIPKSRKALERYGHQLVIANMLHTRKHVVHLIHSDANEDIRLTEQEIKDNVEIESHIISHLMKLHDKWIVESINIK
ncbi:Phosphopantothenate--cysteine ligase cab2 [Batrachochytrium dendrobatidis]|nr:Phosphopantothenate--cysteine ligase cab2 [Batrachochytrium dendrobatidis]KAK5666595.1 Phosphopantothenate--cysteine ligase cab2 [Batrachochytrium dendrobatidis]